MRFLQAGRIAARGLDRLSEDARELFRFLQESSIFSNASVFEVLEPADALIGFFVRSLQLGLELRA